MMINKTISFENPEGGKPIKFDVRNLSHTSSYSSALVLHFAPQTPAATRYGENFEIRYKNNDEMHANKGDVLELIASKQELIVAEMDQNSNPPQNQQQFNQVAPNTVGMKIDRAIEAARNFGKRFRLRR